jgi:predicted phage terminase large subunit-like protein
MQRLHEQDLAGRLIAAGWPSLVLPARAIVTEEFRLSSTETYVRKEGELLQSLRDSVEDLETTKRQVGSHDFSAQYQQDPLPAKGNIIKAEFLRRYTDLPRFSGLSQVLITCDPASKPGEHNDYTALLAARIAGNHVYILECARGHWTNVQIRARIEDLALRHRADIILVEDTAIGPALIQDLRATLRVPTLGRNPKGSKEERLYAREGMFEAGQVLLPINQPWSMDFEKELLGFPSARNDDQVDALLLALEHFGQAQASRVAVPLVGPIIVTSPRSFPRF